MNRLYLHRCHPNSCRPQAYRAVWFLGRGRWVCPGGCAHWSTHSPSSLATCWHSCPPLGTRRPQLVQVLPSKPRKIPVELARTFPSWRGCVPFVPSTDISIRSSTLDGRGNQLQFQGHL